MDIYTIVGEQIQWLFPVTLVNFAQILIGFFYLFFFWKIEVGHLTYEN